MSAKIPKNVRFRKDQIAALNELQDEETDFSELVRTAVDELLLKRQTSRARETPPRYGGGGKRKKHSS